MIKTWPRLFPIVKSSSRASQRYYSHDQRSKQKSDLLNAYQRYKGICHTLKPPKEAVNPKGVFANNELDLKEISVYGFDYDYTLAYYNTSLYQLIFNLARDSLVEDYKYPFDLKNLEYIPGFPIRGLHLDIRKGWLMKIDSYHHIQLGTVYHGLYPVENDEVLKKYDGQHVRIEDIGYSQTSSTLHHFVDLFCLPEICLVACTIQYFIDKGIHFNPEYIFQDIHHAVSGLHRSQTLHRKITQSIDDYLLPLPQHNLMDPSIHIKEFLTRLNKGGKKVFLITNSPFWFVNFGMASLCGSDWANLFDVIICNARKPDFFTSQSKPFREFNINSNSKSWEKVTALKKGHIYYEGNLFEMLEHTGWSRNKVLYFGDHIYGDLAEPFLKHGWRTGAILNEIESEIQVINKISYHQNAAWLITLEKLIGKAMFLGNAVEDLHLPESIQELQIEWLREREEIRQTTKKCFNPYFGSVFRSYHQPSFFSRRLSRFADIYTSNVTHLLNYPIDHRFIPRRIDLAHEPDHYLDIQIEL